MKWYL